ncbi:Formamidopyrimidine-DNA glycosylase [Beijerinckiaceae bacterium RH AL1]|nr:Formamidopyrimidine-DNA glycosylase [Beijerinckiaceae bacterium RH CH11]VVB49556.1 Formamidopyrimidine-DNA glycosylase [Beijerinckiaceae bacterium RH AL8]VVC56921.1 Formamidopyrimidine-DNA glycosylase [Beijerinckiaceae bacterium RH AL1]
MRRGLAPAFVGATIDLVDQRRPDLRFPFPARFASRLMGRRVEALDRRAKYLQARLDDGTILVMHLGMSGSFRIEADDVLVTPGAFHHPRSALKTHDHVVLSLSNGVRIVYNDPRRFGFMLLVPEADLSAHPLFASLGLEPLSDELDGAALAARLAGKKTPLKAALLDQTLIAGLGNIYVCEALHRAGLSPRRAAGTLAKRDGSPTARADKLARVIKEVLLEAVAAGGSTLRDHKLTDGSLGYFQHAFRVYDRLDDPCPNLKCNGVVTRIVQSGRSTFFCPVCQR